MKRFFAFFTLVAFCLVSYGNNPESEFFTATPTGVGPVQIALSSKDIPASFEGLYDSFTTETVEDEMDGNYTVLHFNLSGVPVMKASIYYDNKIGSIEVLGSNIVSKDGINPGTKVQQLLDKGAKSTMSNDGQLTVELGEIGYYVSGLKESGVKKLDQAYMTGEDPKITAQDYDSTATVVSFSIY